VAGYASERTMALNLHVECSTSEPIAVASYSISSIREDRWKTDLSSRSMASCAMNV
jgi:hypothetical protein